MGGVKMSSHAAAIEALRKKLRASMGERIKLTKLHSEVTERINDAFGEEKELLSAFRLEIKDALSCRVLDRWEAK
jgi:hypothetical protein